MRGLKSHISRRTPKRQNENLVHTSSSNSLQRICPISIEGLLCRNPTVVVPSYRHFCKGWQEEYEQQIVPLTASDLTLALQGTWSEKWNIFFFMNIPLHIYSLLLLSLPYTSLVRFPLAITSLLKKLLIFQSIVILDMCLCILKNSLTKGFTGILEGRKDTHVNHFQMQAYITLHM